MIYVSYVILSTLPYHSPYEYSTPRDASPAGHDGKTECAREMFESSLQRPRARVLLTQGKAPQDLNGLLLVHPEDSDVFVPRRFFNRNPFDDR